jgi:anaerobic selenocysteine-containing dehydrogenase
MKIDRRCFLSLGVGAAAGTVLSPLPWKITDDLSIWTQMWPWTPWPAQGKNTFTNSVSTLCTDGCGITVRKVGERAVKIEGMASFPGNEGGICNLCAAGLQLHYGPTRVREPLMRVGERGQGQWRPVSWEQALGEVSRQLGGVRKAGTPEALGAIVDRPYGTVSALFKRFLTAFGSPNFIYTPTMTDAYATVLRLTHGTDSLAGFDLEHADYILSFGSGIIDGWGSPVRMFRAHSQWKTDGATVKQVEPRLSNTAAQSSQWLPVNPGSEGALALGLAHIIIKESLYDYDFVNNYASGFERFRDLVLTQFSPGNVSRLTGVDQSTIVSVAREFARARHPLAICGRGQGRTAGELGYFLAVHALNALMGTINRPGGVWALPAPDYIQWPEPPLDDVARGGLAKARLDGAGSAFPVSRSLPHRLPAALRDQKPYGLQVLLVYGANPLYTLPGQADLQQAFGQVPFIVSFATHLDETAAFADLVLPAPSHLERYEDVPATAGYPRPLIGLARPVVAREGDTRHPADILIQLAAALGGSLQEAFPWPDYNTCLQETLADRWETMEADGFWVNDRFQPDNWVSAFTTASGRYDFYPAEAKDGALFQPLEPEGDVAQFPLVLIPYDTVRISNGPVASPPFLIKTVADNVLKGTEMFVEINPESAKALGLREGSAARLATPLGSAQVRVHLSHGIMPGLVGAPRGLGHTAYDDYLAGKGINVNALVGAVSDPASGLDAAWGIRASLAKA